MIKPVITPVVRPVVDSHFKLLIDKPMVWVVPPGVTHITIQRTADGEVLEKRAVKPGQIIMLDELNARANDPR